MTTRDKKPWTIEDDEVLDRLIENFRRTDLGWPVNLALPDDPRDLVKPGAEVVTTLDVTCTPVVVVQAEE